MSADIIGVSLSTCTLIIIAVHLEVASNWTRLRREVRQAGRGQLSLRGMRRRIKAHSWQAQGREKGTMTLWRSAKVFYWFTEDSRFGLITKVSHKNVGNLCAYHFTVSSINSLLQCDKFLKFTSVSQVASVTFCCFNEDVIEASLSNKNHQTCQFCFSY